MSRPFIGLALLLAGATGWAQVAQEGQLKAAFIINFVKYVEWPTQRETTTICLFGRDSLGAYLAPYEGRDIVGQTIRIRSVSSQEQLSNCHLLFVPDTEEARFAAVMRWVGRQPILTISDSEFFLRDGGGIALLRNEGRLQFDINLNTLGRSGLKANSQMLRLARQVLGGTR